MTTKKKTVKAFTVTDGKNIINIGTKTKGLFNGLYMVGTSKEYMEEQWKPYKVISCIITYEV